MSALSPVVLFEFQLLDHVSSGNLYCGFTASLMFAVIYFSCFAMTSNRPSYFLASKSTRMNRKWSAGTLNALLFTYLVADPYSHLLCAHKYITM